MPRCFYVSLLVTIAWNHAAQGAESLQIRSGRFAAAVRNGSLVRLKSAAGLEFVQEPAEPRGTGIHRVPATHWATASDESGELSKDQALTRQSGKFTDLSDATVDTSYRLDAASGDLVLEQRARSPADGVWGVSWWIADIPLDFAILVPGGSGLRLSRETPGSRHQFDYPISWEAQFVVVEGPGQGFFVWAEDPQGRFKRLVVERRSSGWRLGFVTINDAPFDTLTACDSVRWRLNVYEGDWRVPARRYRDWLAATLQPVRVKDQSPAWAREIRACVIMGLELPVLEALPRRLDPQQTLLYLPEWRTAGYDRNYPDYDQPVPQLEPFVRRAHELGFRVMLHVNYFGVDPLHPLYPQFEPFQVLDPWDKHEPQWWVWPPEEPDIRFAYINPACRAWRDCFVKAMVKLCNRTGTDSLHLDQTLCIYNDHRGRIEGQSMLEGSLALHRALREALPQVALSGEGLNEVTCRYEAFAQRHVWGLDHSKGTWDRRWLAAAHPISSYVLRPFTTMYGYLGCAPPDADQLYAAWNEAYRHWGIIPTLKPTLAALAEPAGFARQFFDEAEFWQRQRVGLDLDGPWPADVAMPLRTADGRPAAAMSDRRLVCGERVVSRTITGVRQVEAPGTIPGWPAYDEQRLLGLCPEGWYPHFEEPRDQRLFHVSRLPKRLTLDGVADLGEIAVVRTRDAATLLADLTAGLDRALCGSRPDRGQTVTALGGIEAEDGAMFTASGEVISAHPPWKIAGSGEVFARFTVPLPGEGTLQFLSEVALDPGAVGPKKSDGVTFFVRAFDNTRPVPRVAESGSEDDGLRAELHQPTAERHSFTLDLTPLAGQTITLELAVGPGPLGSPSFDWARWYRPRIEQSVRGADVLAVSGGKPWTLALGGAGAAPIRRDGETAEVRVPVPGTVYFLRQSPPAVRLPVDVSRQTFQLLFVKDSGQAVPSAQYAAVSRQPTTVAGVSREGLFAHPPDHGRTVALFPMFLPTEPSRFETWIGIRDGSKSDGVIFAVEINGRELARRKLQPGAWAELTADLATWAGQSVVLSLVTDSDGPFLCDWAAWGEPRITAGQASSP